jgi:sterol desaturase/sphingolipid hydroxylase (fatty acid hydroxylase superfamily)
VLDDVTATALIAWRTVVAAYSEPALYVGTALLLIVERVFPVRRPQSPWRIGFLQDAVWVGVQAISFTLVLTAYAAFLTGIYQARFDSLTVHAVERLPTYAKWALWILAVDLLEWSHHWLKHKVPWFWQFHAVHHSQRELNLFTDLRYHFVEYLISRTVVTFPLLMLQADMSQVVYFSIFHPWYTQLNHASIRTDLGPLRYLLVTPQSHRIHHSIEPAHRDRNFGVIFSCWDWLFGTQHRGWHECPDTGILDPRFPIESSRNPLALLLTPIRQHVYPFVAIARSLVRPAVQSAGDTTGGPGKFATATSETTPFGTAFSSIKISRNG